MDKFSSEPDIDKQELYEMFIESFQLPRQHFEQAYQVELEKTRADLELGIKFTRYGDTDYPLHFYRLEDPPLILSYQGRACWNQFVCLAVVGSRDPMPVSVHWMKSEFYRFLKESKVKICIVSGGARGIDELSHRIALLADHPTVLFMPSGLCRPYPNNLQSLRDQILQNGGALVSEYDSNLSMKKPMFSHRNRLIAAMNQSLLIVEAQKKSGTLMTANYALAMGRTVLVIPGHPLNAAFQGSLEIIKHGGALIEGAEDLYHLLDEFKFESSSGSHSALMNSY